MLKSQLEYAIPTMSTFHIKKKLHLNLVNTLVLNGKPHHDFAKQKCVNNHYHFSLKLTTKLYRDEAGYVIVHGYGKIKC